MIRSALKNQLHPRNRFRSGYDFPALVERHSPLAAFVRPNPHGEASVDYANPAAVKALNQALLKQAYGIETWDVPPGYLCPPIPGRSDYLHHLADLLRGSDSSPTPSGRSIAVLDIGVGASCIFRSSARATTAGGSSAPKPIPWPCGGRRSWSPPTASWPI
jgi:23S rRNA (adenine1618-N6)-methyltransferase